MKKVSAKGSASVVPLHHRAPDKGRMLDRVLKQTYGGKLLPELLEDIITSAKNSDRHITSIAGFSKILLSADPHDVPTILQWALDEMHREELVKNVASS